MQKAGRKYKEMKCRNFNLSFSRTIIMGILNATPDSFSDGGLFVDGGNADVNKAVQHAKQMADDGADVIDIGGESTRPSSEPISEEEELQRVLPVIKKLVKEVNLPLSIDTYKPRVAEKCLEMGVHLINDITGLRNKEMIKIAARHKAPVVVMHMKGEPKSMQENPVYKDVVNEIKGFLRERIIEANNNGVNNVIIDPGIGFGKSAHHNLQILKRLAEFKDLGCPILVGPSRKSFIGNVTGLAVSDRLEGTLAAISIAVMNGANIVRVHDVKECRRAVQIADAVRGA